MSINSGVYSVRILLVEEVNRSIFGRKIKARIRYYEGTCRYDLVHKSTKRDLILEIDSHRVQISKNSYVNVEHARYLYDMWSADENIYKSTDDLPYSESEKIYLKQQEELRKSHRPLITDFGYMEQQYHKQFLEWRKKIEDAADKWRKGEITAEQFERYADSLDKHKLR